MREKNDVNDGFVRCVGFAGLPLLVVESVLVLRRSGVGRLAGDSCGGALSGLPSECTRSCSCFHCWRRAGETKPSLRPSQRGLTEGRGGAVVIVGGGDEEDDDGET